MISFKSKNSQSDFLTDEKVLSSLAGLELLVKKTVEGIRGGIHRAATSGSSVEFSEHLRYYPGQDLKNVDWKAFARTDRYFVKSYEKEARLLAMNILDCSGSMNYKGSRTEFSKFDFSKIISGAISYLLLKQGDSAGAIFFADDILSTVPIDSRPEHLMFL
ncbi:MAG: DUF58 domain-containing protein, partial [Deltaproteobacteria bacterium]|nr:DUF58 domain-containing protein [Deltaproteobacteria bacterium]